jgi:predicted HicB family RNase H-like nuclease
MSDNRKRYTLRMPEELFQDLGSVAAAQGVSLNALILQALWEYVEKKRKRRVSN